MSLFPGAIPVFAGFTSSHTLLADTHAAQHNLEQAEIVNIATKIGTGAATPVANTVLRSSSNGTSTWGQVALTTDVTGTLPVGSGGTGSTNLTFPSGPDTLVARTSTDTLTNKTLTTPTIASFINAIHTHASNAQGGQLDFGALLSTIFSGQVTTYTNPGTAGGTNTFFYINLGGIKLFWGATANQTSNNAAPSYAVTLPAGFFNSVQAPVATAVNMTADGRQYVAVSAFSTVTVTMSFNAPNGAATTAASLILIGT